jgi:hypothetical protein
MGHRALLAYRRGADDAAGTADPTDCDDDPADSDVDARYDLHRSHWGAADFALCGHLSPETPFAGDSHVAVDPDPVATDLSLADAVANHLDFLHHEAFYRVGLDYETTAYHVCWFGLEADSETVARSETVGHGALIEAHPDDADYLRGWFRGTKSVVGEMVDRETFTPETAAQFLAGRAETWAADRAVILPD